MATLNATIASDRALILADTECALTSAMSIEPVTYTNAADGSDTKTFGAAVAVNGLIYQLSQKSREFNILAATGIKGEDIMVAWVPVDTTVAQGDRLTEGGLTHSVLHVYTDKGALLLFLRQVANQNFAGDAP